MSEEQLSKDRYKYREELKEHIKKISKSRCCKDVAILTARHIATKARLDFCAVALKKVKRILKKNFEAEEEVYFELYGVADRTSKKLKKIKDLELGPKIKAIDYVINKQKYLEKDYIKYELSKPKRSDDKLYFESLLSSMESLCSEVIFPAYSGDELVGLLLLGSKLDKTMYSQEDLQNFETLTAQAAKAVSEVIVREENLNIIKRICSSDLAALDARDHYTRGHTERVKEYVIKISSIPAIKSQIEKITEGQWALELAAELHDLGKIGIPDAVLNKNGKLEAEQWNIMKKHPEQAIPMIIQIAPWIKNDVDVIKGVLQHHENYDGTGYPFGLKGKDIHLFARIIRIADSIDAMASRRPYKEPMDMKDVLKEIEKGSNSLYDPEIVELFLKSCKEAKELIELEKIKNKDASNDLIETMQLIDILKPYIT